MRTFTRRLTAAAASVLLVTAGAAAPALASDGSRHGRSGSTLLRSSLLGSLTSDPTVAGVRPGGRDWTQDGSRVKVKTSGRADIRVRNLVFTDIGSNTVPQASASLVCGGQLVDTLGPVTFSAAGDARIRGTFDVPERCLAPAVLIHPATNTAVYIGVSGGLG